MYKKTAVFIGLLVLPALAVFFLASGDHSFTELPYLGPKEPYDTIVDGEARVDTHYFQVPPFVFTNQDGEKVTEKDMRGKIYVADFFFTRCKTICPTMTTQLRRVADGTKDFDGVMIMSHTIDPDNDTEEVLKAYANKYEADTERWHFVRGSMEYTHDFARSSYLLGVEQDNNAQGGFLHSEYLILVDRKGHLRGIYKGTNTKEVTSLIDEIKVLLKEQPGDKD